MEWLISVAGDIVKKTFSVKNPSYPNDDDDHVYMYHRAVLHMGFLYTTLREAIRYENGPQIIRLWRFWLLHFLGCKRKNYAFEAANLLANLAANWSPEIAYIHTHCRTVNTMGKPGSGKPIDQLNEHYNL